MFRLVRVTNRRRYFCVAIKFAVSYDNRYPIFFFVPKKMYAFTGSRFTVQGYLWSEVVTSQGNNVFSRLYSTSLYSSIFILLPSVSMNRWFRLDLNSNRWTLNPWTVMSVDKLKILIFKFFQQWIHNPVNSQEPGFIRQHFGGRLYVFRSIQLRTTVLNKCPSRFGSGFEVELQT